MRNRNGFTLIELLVVITIIVVLAGLLIPGVLRAMKQAKSNRALSEMQHLATVITQVYSEVGYYVRLEDLAKDLSAIKGTTVPAEIGKMWAYPPATYADGEDDNNTLTSFPSALEGLWVGPYTTYKNYITTTPAINHYRPLDPWGMMGNSDAGKHQYRMFWINSAGSADLRVPAGATGAMVIISAGGDGKYQCGISTPSEINPAIAVQADFAKFNPITADKGDDVYYIFNAGIQ